MNKRQLLHQIKGYYFITAAELSREGNFHDICTALRAKVTVVQYRNKSDNSRFLYNEASRLRQICRKIVFIINDRLDIALAVNADGVHLGQEDIPCSVVRRILGRDKIIGVTVRSLSQAEQAVEEGADYLGVGPIFPTQTKNISLPALGVDIIRKIKKINKKAFLPIVAIGGINLANVRKVIESGADAVCAISSVVGKPDMETRISQFQSLFF